MKSWSQRLEIPVEEYSTPNPETASVDANYRELVQKMKRGNFRHLLIVDNDEVVGIVSQRDLKVLEGLGEDADKLIAEDFMSRDLYIESPQTPLEKVVFEMSKRKIGSAVLQDKTENYLGIFTSTDALNALVEVLRGEAEA
jgi:acetoin utilization protein AcuB